MALTSTHEAVTSRSQFETPFHFGITFVRHGESFGNKLQVVQGQKDYPLSTMGITQAQQLGQNSLQNLRVSHVYSSDLSRSLKTAEIVCQSLLNSPQIIMDSRLRERGFGALEGMRLDQFRGELRQAGVQLNQFKPPGGETVSDVRSRAIAFFEDLFTTMRAFHKEQQNLPPPDPCSVGFCALPTEFQVPSGKRDHELTAPKDPLKGSVLIFSHGGWIREALIWLEQQFPFCSDVQRKHLTAVTPNCGISTLTVKLYEKKTTISCLWMHQVFHVSDNVQATRTHTARNRMKPVSRSVSLPAGRPTTVDTNEKFLA